MPGTEGQGRVALCLPKQQTCGHATLVELALVTLTIAVFMSIL
jgi:hypothetical protein